MTARPASIKNKSNWEGLALLTSNMSKKPVQSKHQTNKKTNWLAAHTQNVCIAPKKRLETQN
jgi:hypothetical protein